jgi:fluoroacetyl-CoA thioesterase
MSVPDVDSTASAQLTVAPSDLASALNLEPADAFPAVFATSRMVALMELAAARVLRPHLLAGELSVGVTVDVIHTAATPPGATVTATAKYVGRDGKLFLFEVSAADNAGEVGRGTHKRAIVTTERLLAGATRRGTGT